MRINFYDTRITEDNRTVLVKEKGVNYATDKANSPEKVVEMMNSLLQMNGLGEEHIYMIATNIKNKITGLFLLSKGTVSQSVTSPREIFIRALMTGASAIILCHNHPSGDPAPSQDDIRMTEQIRQAGMLLNIPLTDHIIIAGDKYKSFREEKLMLPPETERSLRRK